MTPAVEVLQTSQVKVIESSNMSHWGCAAGMAGAFAAGMAQAGLSNMGGGMPDPSRCTGYGGIPTQPWETKSVSTPLDDIKR